MSVEELALLAERDALAATVERVRALHHEGAPFVRFCGQDRRCSCGGRWPCPTIRALDTTPDTGGEGDDRRLCRECRIKAGWTVEW